MVTKQSELIKCALFLLKGFSKTIPTAGPMLTHDVRFDTPLRFVEILF